MTGQGYTKMALQIHMKCLGRESSMWSAFERPEGMGNGGLFWDILKEFFSIFMKKPENGKGANKNMAVRT